MLRRINIAAVVALYASLACDSSAPAPVAPARTEADSAPVTAPPTFEPPPCVPSSLGFEFADEGAVTASEELTWQRPMWLQLHTSLNQQTLFQTTNALWQASTHTETAALVRWELGIEVANRTGEPSQVELNVLAITGRPPDALATLGALPEAGLSLACRSSPQGAWVCRGRGDQGQLTPWPASLPNPLQLIALQKRPPAADRPALTLDGMRLPPDAQTRLRSGTLDHAGASLLSWTGDRTLATAWDVQSESTASGHIAWSARPGRPFRLASCTGEQAAGQATAAGDLLRWSVRQSTQSATAGYLTSISRTHPGD
jgi:hypothetical protein